MNTHPLTQPKRVYIIGNGVTCHEQELINVARECCVILDGSWKSGRHNGDDIWSAKRKCIDECRLVVAHFSVWDAFGGGFNELVGTLMYAIGKGIPVFLALDPDLPDSVPRDIKWLESATGDRIYRFVSEEAFPQFVKAAVLEVRLARRIK